MKVVKGENLMTSTASDKMKNSTIKKYCATKKIKASTVSKIRKITKVVDKKENNIRNNILLLLTDLFFRYSTT